MPVTVHALIRGRVQGVSFRESTRRQAAALGVTGWVRNLADGRVEAVLAGDATSVEAMTAWCRVGPPSAQVEAVEAEAMSGAPQYQGFAVLPTAAAPLSASSPGGYSGSGPRDR